MKYKMTEHGIYGYVENMAVLTEQPSFHVVKKTELDDEVSYEYECSYMDGGEMMSYYDLMHNKADKPNNVSYELWEWKWDKIWDYRTGKVIYNN